MCMHAQSCLTLRPMDCSPPGSSVHGISQTGMGGYFLLHRIFLTQGLNLSLLYCGWILYLLSPWGSPQVKNTCHKKTITKQ